MRRRPAAFQALAEAAAAKEDTPPLAVQEARAETQVLAVAGRPAAEADTWEPPGWGDDLPPGFSANATVPWVEPGNAMKVVG